ncbi:MAG TPA: hypothetical protein VGF06_04670 [Terriglobales bacterium]|jgi:hypothetical protein
MPETWWEWGVLALAVLVVGGIGASFFLYLRTAYRRGGWREVRVYFILAIVALVALFVVRATQNNELQQLKKAVDRTTK